MPAASNIRLLFISSLLGYVAYLSAYGCKTNSTFCQNFNYSLDVASSVLDPVQPYIHAANVYVRDNAIEPIGSKVSELYSDHLKDSVDLFHEKVGTKVCDAIDDKVIQPIVYPAYDKAQDILQSSVYPKMSEAMDQTKKHGKIYLIKAYVNGRAATEFAMFKTTEYAQAFKYKLVTYWVPQFCDLCNRALRFLNIVVRPQVINLFEKYAKPYCSAAWHVCKMDVVANLIHDFYLKFISSAFFLKASEAFSRRSFSKYYAEAESKKDFVKSECNRIFNAGFKLGENIQNGWKDSDKLIKNKLYKDQKESLATFTSALMQETVTATSTIEASTITVTQTSSISPTKVDHDISKSAKSWEKVISKTCEAAVSDLVTEIEAAQAATIKLYQPKLTAELQNLSKIINTGYKDVSASIKQINGTDLSRQEFRDILGGYRKQIDSQTGSIKAMLAEASNNTDVYIADKRVSTLEILEQFSEFAIEEAARDLDVTGAEEDSEYWAHFKELRKLKQTLSETKDKVTSLKPDISDLRKMVREVEGTLNIFINESGHHLAMLRAKANLAFQTREERERSASASRFAESDPKASDRNEPKIYTEIPIRITPEGKVVEDREAEKVELSQNEDSEQEIFELPDEGTDPAVELEEEITTIRKTVTQTVSE